MLPRVVGSGGAAMRAARTAFGIAVFRRQRTGLSRAALHHEFVDGDIELRHPFPDFLKRFGSIGI